MRIATSTTPPWVQIDHQLAGWAATTPSSAAATRRAARRPSRHRDRSRRRGPPASSPGENRASRSSYGHPVALVARVELGEALVDADLGADRPGRRTRPSRSPGGRGWRRARPPRAHRCDRGAWRAARTAPGRRRRARRTCGSGRSSASRCRRTRRGGSARAGWSLDASDRSCHRWPKPHVTGSLWRCRVGAVPAGSRLTITDNR